MRLLALPFLVLLVVASPSLVVAQAPTLTLNGIATGASFVAGDTVTWVITVPSGTQVSNELWVDVNGNTVADSSTDKTIFLFTQQDGGFPSDGPGDDDGTANGVITSTFPLGLAPARWIFVTSNASGSDTSWFDVQRLSSPVATVGGTVTAPGGVDKSYILIEASPDSLEGNVFWQGLTDSSGAYTIEFGGNALSMNPWRIRLEGESLSGGLVAARRDTTVTIGGTPPVVNFTLLQGTVLTGRVVDQAGAPVVDATPHTHDAPDPSSGGGYHVRTDSDGRYWVTVVAGNYFMHFVKDGYKDQWWNGQPSSQTATQISVTNQDTIFGLNGTLIRAGLIRGVVTHLGSPVRADVRLFLTDSTDMGSRETQDDGTYGFTVDPGTYYVRFEYQGQVQWYNNTTSYPPAGITVTGTETIDNVNAAFGTTNVGPGPLVPSAFALHQNFPNPFNPSTTIVYDVPATVHVTVSVYSILGIEVARLVDAPQRPGTHSATFDAGHLPSGLYFLQVKADGFRAVRKMTLLR